MFKTGVVELTRKTSGNIFNFNGRCEEMNGLINTSEGLEIEV